MCCLIPAIKTNTDASTTFHHDKSEPALLSIFFYSDGEEFKYKRKGTERNEKIDIVFDLKQYPFL